MDKWREEPEDAEDQDGDLDCDQDDQNANIKYEVYECQDGGLGDASYQEYDGSMAMANDQYHNMTVVPGPVHNAHQLQFPPTCT